MAKRRAKRQPAKEQQTMGDIVPKPSKALSRVLDGYRDALTDKGSATKELKTMHQKVLDQMAKEELTSIDFVDANGNSKTLTIEAENKIKLRKKKKDEDDE